MKRPEVLPHTVEALQKLILEMLDVPLMRDETRKQWRRGRAANIAMEILNDFCGECPTCREIVAIRECSDVTEELELRPGRGPDWEPKD